MDGQFITNKKLILSDVINSILPKCDNAYFWVGYFYYQYVKAHLYRSIIAEQLK